MKVFGHRNQYGTVDVFCDGEHGRRWLGDCERDSGLWSFNPVDSTYGDMQPRMSLETLIGEIEYFARFGQHRSEANAAG